MNNANVVVHTCEFFIVSKNRKCLRKTRDQYCYQHKQAAANATPRGNEKEQEQVSDGDDEDDNTCAICLSSLDANLCHLEPCNHIFHSECFSKLYTIECPLCRAIPTNVLVASMKNLSSEWLRQHPDVGRSIQKKAEGESRQTLSTPVVPVVVQQQQQREQQQGEPHSIEVSPERRSLKSRILDFLLCRRG